MKRRTILLAAAVLLTACASAAVFLRYRAVSRDLIAMLDSRTARRFGRQVRFKNIRFSPLKGVVLEGACVSRAPDFSKGVFFCADLVEIKPELAMLMKHRMSFSEVKLENPVFSLREKGGRWDFEDLLARLPKTSKGLYLTWNAKKLVLENAKVEADLESSGRSFALENADVTVTHYSGVAGNFGMEMKGGLKSAFGGSLLTSSVTFRSDLNFTYSGLSSSFGEAEFADSSLGAITLERTRLTWELFNMDEPASRMNYSAHWTADGLFIPAQSCAAGAWVNSALTTLSSIMGRGSEPVEDIRLDSLAVDFALKEGRLCLRRLDLDSNFLKLGAEYELDGPACSVALKFGARTGGQKLDLTARGPMNTPEISPAMSVTLHRKVTEAIAGLNGFFVKLFPITPSGDTHV